MSGKRCLKTVQTGCISAANPSMGTGEVPWNGLLAIRAFLAAEPLTLSLGAGRAAAADKKLDKARFLLYRSQILQENMRWKALAEIYKMHSFAPFSWDL